jgi:hypothetical protein
MHDAVRTGEAFSPVEDLLLKFEEQATCLRTMQETLARIAKRLDQEDRTGRSEFTVDEFASMVGKAKFTVREWCRLGRIKAKKRPEKRGRHATWSISSDELMRYRNEGLLPVDPTRNRRAA